MATISYFGKLFLALSDHIKATVPEVKWIDQDFGQLEQFEYRPAVAFPCVLIDYPLANYTGLSELSQLADITVQFRIGFAPFSQSNAEAPLSVREKALEYYQLEQKLYEAIQGFSTEYTQPLIRINAGTEQRLSANDVADNMGLRVRVMNFSTQFEDNSKLPVYNQTPATLEVDQEVILPD
jgi:hypothetical protein